MQRWGESPQDVEAGDAVVIPPGEKHWHGAVPGARGVHLALNVNVTTEWLEPVTDDQYQWEVGLIGCARNPARGGLRPDLPGVGRQNRRFPARDDLS